MPKCLQINDKKPLRISNRKPKAVSGDTREFIFSQYLEETSEIGVRIFRARKETLLDPVCVGDVITTAFSLKSRNQIIELLASNTSHTIQKTPSSRYIFMKLPN